MIASLVRSVKNKKTIKNKKTQKNKNTIHFFYEKIEPD